MTRSSPSVAPDVRVRAATADDAATIATLTREVHAMHATALSALFQPATATVATAAEFAALAVQPDRVLLVATVDGVVVGFAHGEVQRAPETAFKRASALLHVHAMAVTAAHRGRGAGRALLAAVRAAAATRRLDGVSLEVYAFNEGARRFYEREGFAVVRSLLHAPLDAAAET